MHQVVQGRNDYHHSGRRPEERLPQPMIPRPTFTTDIPSIREADEINLSESLEMLKLKDVMDEENVAATVQWQETLFLQVRRSHQLHLLQRSSLISSVFQSQKGIRSTDKTWISAIPERHGEK